MDPIRKKLWSDLREVLAELGRACHVVPPVSAETFCASSDAGSGNDAGLCYFHLN